jgi:pyruvate-formate lyase
MKLQQQNFHRLLSSAASTTSSSSVAKQQQISQIHSVREDDQTTYISTTTATNDRTQPIKQMSDNQRAVLHQRKQALMKAIQSINMQMEELDM